MIVPTVPNMKTLNEWVGIRAKKPLSWILALTIVFFVVYFGYSGYNRYQVQSSRIEQARESISLGIQQSNRPLVESAILSLLADPGFSLVALCHQGSAIIAYPTSAGGIGCGQEVHTLTTWRTKRDLIGVDGYGLLVQYSPVDVFGPLLVLVSVAGAMFWGVLFVIFGVRKNFQTDILAPLVHGLSGEQPLSIEELENLRLKNLQRMQLISSQAAAEAMVLISVQVAHDIRSPLAALGAAARGLDLPEEKRTLIDASIARMQGIADDLLQRYRAPGAAAARPETCALAGLIEQVLAEKRIQHKDRPGVKIEFYSSADGVKAAVDTKELQRIISNLVNNSIEAFAGPGTVAVRLAATDGKVLIEVKDDGKGIPAEILGRLGAKGETHGKAGGTGLGLYHARISAESWGGSLRIESAPGKGTSVVMELPAAAKPAAGLRAVLLDDDLLVHMNWRMAAKAAGADLKAYKTAEEFAAAAGTLPRDIPVYIDSELGDGVKGEDIAKDLHGRGFTDLTMATGHGAEKFADLPWLKVTGKEPPWA